MDLESGREIQLSRGRLLEAVEASSAIPGIFPPVFVDGHYMVDGGLLNPTPGELFKRSKYGYCNRSSSFKRYNQAIYFGHGMGKIL